MAQDNARFVVIHEEGGLIEGVRRLFVDKETGVTYLHIKTGYSGTMSPLYNADGTLVITKFDENK